MQRRASFDDPIGGYVMEIVTESLSNEFLWSSWLRHMSGGYVLCNMFSLVASDAWSLWVIAAVQKIGVLVWELWTTVLEYRCWSQYKMVWQSLELAPVPWGFGRWSDATLAQCCGHNNGMCMSGMYKLSDRMMVWMDPLSSCMLNTKSPIHVAFITSLMPSTVMDWP